MTIINIVGKGTSQSAMICVSVDGGGEGIAITAECLGKPTLTGTTAADGTCDLMDAVPGEQYTVQGALNEDTYGPATVRIGHLVTEVPLELDTPVTIPTLEEQVAGKQDTLTAGKGIELAGNTISLDAEGVEAIPIESKADLLDALSRAKPGDIITAFQIGGTSGVKNLFAMVSGVEADVVYLRGSYEGYDGNGRYPMRPALQVSSAEGSQTMEGYKEDGTVFDYDWSGLTAAELEQAFLVRCSSVGTSTGFQVTYDETQGCYVFSDGSNVTLTDMAGYWRMSW